MQAERTLRAAIFLAKIRDSPIRAHAYRLRCAKKVADIIDQFIAEEARKANNESKNDPAYLSWEQIGSCLDIPKTTAYQRYGKKQ